MKLRIEIKFTDKFTGKHYNIGDVKEFEEARAKELLADKRGLVSAIETAEPVEHEIKHTKKAKK